MNKKLIFFLGSGGLTDKLTLLQGTVGTIEALVLFFFLNFLFPGQIQLICYFSICFFTLASILLGASYENYLSAKDPPSFVLDEMAGFFCSVIFLPVSVFYVLAAFVLFRVFDVWKPLLIGKSQKLPGGIGMVIDDLLAGICANICCQILRYFLK